MLGTIGILYLLYNVFVVLEILLQSLCHKISLSEVDWFIISFIGSSTLHTEQSAGLLTLEFFWFEPCIVCSPAKETVTVTCCDFSKPVPLNAVAVNPTKVIPFSFSLFSSEVNLKLHPNPRKTEVSLVVTPLWASSIVIHEVKFLNSSNARLLWNNNGMFFLLISCS